MLLTLLYCVTIGWAPATGPVSTYDLLIDGILHQEAIVEPAAAVCLQDQDPHIITVRAKGADGTYGPMSDGSDAIQMTITPPLYAFALDQATRADLDEDGVVGYTDFFIFAGVFQKCNDGKVEKPCP